jgi:hypothetical protein
MLEITMHKSIVKLALAGLLALSTASPGLAHHNDDAAAAIIAGGLIGAAAIAASSHHHHHHDQYVPPPYYTPGAPFSPARGIICYPRERACYDNDGFFKPKWTYRVF